MGLIAETAEVFAFLQGVYAALPVAIKILIYSAFGGIIYIAVMRSIWR